MTGPGSAAFILAAHCRRLLDSRFILRMTCARRQKGCVLQSEHYFGACIVSEPGKENRQYIISEMSRLSSMHHTVFPVEAVEAEIMGIANGKSAGIDHVRM